MENAAKALTIAGGILLGIIVITTFIYSLQQWGIYPGVQDKITEDEQLLEFNNQFESYNKQNIYGADIVTLLHRANNNNIKYNIVDDTNDPYYVNIKLKIEYQVESYTRKIVETLDKNGIRNQLDNQDDRDLHTYLETREYDLSELVKKNTDKSILDKISVDGEMEPPKITTKVDKITGKSTITTEIKYSNAEIFRLKKFTCVSVKYHPENGRIAEMYFKELEESQLSPID